MGESGTEVALKQYSGGGKVTDARVARTYRIEPETAERVKGLAAALEVYDSHLVEHLLTYALDAVDEGALRLQRRAVRWELEQAR